MNIFLWVLQGILAIKLLHAAASHGPLQGRPEMQTAALKLGRAAPLLHWLSAAGMLLGAAGLILPGLIGWPAEVTSAAAASVGGLLLGSILLHLRSREKPRLFVSLVLFVFAALVAWARLGLPAF